MARILIIAHAPLATSLLEVARHVFPDCGSTVGAVDVPAQLSLEDAQALVRQALLACGSDEVLILTDVFGATPCNAALAAAEGARTRVVAGVNVPMLWRTLCYQDKTLEDMVGRAVAGAAQGVMHVAVPRRQNQAVSTTTHDQVDHHHQQ
jgi:PTS system mannose-specific IIA component